MQSRETQANELTALVTAMKLNALTTQTAAVTAMCSALVPSQPAESGRSAPAQPSPVDTRITRALISATEIALVGAGSKYASAYIVGRGLGAMIPDDGKNPAEPTSAMINALDLLSSDLPSHAARSVAQSMGLWVAAKGSADRSLRAAQVLLWRTVLIGEKKGTELLEPDDYLEAAGELEHKYAKRITSSRSVLGLFASACLLFAAGIVALCLESKTGVTLAGVSGVLAALGLTWKGVGSTAGKLVGKLEVPVWGAELDTAIRIKITLINVGSKPAKPAAPLNYGDRKVRLTASASEIVALPPAASPDSEEEAVAATSHAR